jgi:hypothetical protein
MLAAAFLAMLWAQAEQAPPPPAAPPTPPQPHPFLIQPAPAAPPNGLTVSARFAYRVGNEGKSIGPAAGFSLGGTFERRYFASRGGVELAGAIDFFYDRFSTGVVGSMMDSTGQETTFAADRALSQTSFALLQTAGWRAADVRVFVAAGAGVTIGYFSSPEVDFRPGSKTAAQPIARGVAGVEVTLSGTTGVILRADYTHAFTRPAFTTITATSYSLFGDILDVGAGLLVRF